jgi:ferric enterobactin receptor
MNVRYLVLSAISLAWLARPLVYGQAKYKVVGQVADAQTATALSYATVRVFKTTDSTLAGGAISDDKGGFSVQVAAGQYYALVEFIGYKPFKTNRFLLSKEASLADLGIVKVSPAAKTLDEVEVRAEKSTMVLTLDKRVFNVGKDLANAGGSASDLLTNIPSVSVDPDGSVKLRGSDNVRILIDGKPSGLVSFKGSAGLQQLQGSMIERVEIITNPSARYEAEGMAGIINIILKKDQQQGFNGSLEVITGYPVNYGLGGNLNYRHKKVNFFINYGLAYRIQPNVGTLFQEVYDGNTTYYSQQDRKGDVKSINNNIRGGLDYFFNEKSILTASYLLRRSDAHRLTDLTYVDYSGSLSNRVRTTYRNQDEREKEPNSEYALSYKKDFARKNHTFSVEVRFLDNWESSNQLFTQNAFLANGTPDTQQTILQNSLNDEYEKQWLLQADYVQPLGKEGKFETGLRSSFRDMVNDFVVNQKNESGVFVPLPGLKNYFIYNENINALYGILGNKSKRFSYQAGLRAEWTDVKTTLRETNQVNPRRYANLFPSVHFTYDLPHENAIQLSYSRRVRRPFYNDLSPFATFSDNRNFFGGNPDLDPEFSNVYELGHIKYFDKGSMSSSVYYRDTHDKIQTIRTVNADGFSITRPENLRSEQSIGVELTSQYAPYKWWKMDYNFNLFHAQIDGSNINDTYKRETLSWFVRHTSRFSLPKNLDVQVRGNYEAPQVTAQGKQLYMFFMDLSLSKDVFKGKGTLNLNVMDVFNSRIRRFNAEGPNFFSVGSSQFRMRQINLTLNVRLKQAKNAKRAKSLINEEGA